MPDVTYKEFIAAVQSRLEDGEERIALLPHLFQKTWWPETSDFGQQLLSDYGVAPEQESEQELEKAFREEVAAIRDSLEETGFEPELAESQKGSKVAAQRIWTSLNTQAAAIRVWDHIAVPVRRQRGLVFRILSPQDVMGSPIIQTLHIDHYILGSAAKTAESNTEITDLREKLRRWQKISGALGVVILFLLLV